MEGSSSKSSFAISYPESMVKLPIFILSGTASIVCDGKPETLTAGQCHYCPKGSTHTMKNNGSDELTFFAVVPEQ